MRSAELDQQEGRQRALFASVTRALKQQARALPPSPPTSSLPHPCGPLVAQVQEGEARQTAIMSKQIHLDAEVRRLHGTRRWLEAAMQDKSVPLAGARRTMLRRAERPARERAQSDEVGRDSFRTDLPRSPAAPGGRGARPSSHPISR